MNTIPYSESKAKNISLWILQILVALAFVGAGVSKITGQPLMVDTFTQIGVGQWLRYLTGGIEVLAAVFLLIPRLIPVGALLLVSTMIGAVLTHLLVIGGSPVPPLVLLILATIIAWGRKNRLAGLLRESF
ncbi:MAG: DoxX family protein [Candidatus Methylacidiphilales bacterium]|nr:DoxX family protein [Candidatus Methylacidiphilales bacterium]